MKKIILITLAGTFFISLPAFGEVSERSMQLIRKFEKASKAKNKRRAEKFYEQLSEDTEAISHMRENLPRTYRAYVFRGLAIRADEMSSNVFSSGQIPGGVPGDVTPQGTNRGTPNRVGSENNNAFRPPNRAVNRGRRFSNYEFTRPTRNQTRISNQDSIRLRRKQRR